MCVPLHYALQGEIAQAVSEALLSQLYISTTGDTGEHHHQGRGLLTATPWIRPMSRRPGHGWRRWVGTSKRKEEPDISRNIIKKCLKSGPGSAQSSNQKEERRFKPARSTRSIGRCSAFGVGLRAWRGERILGVEAGEFGSGGSSGSG